MSDGYAIAAISMNNDMQRLQSISQNLTNALTPGYKREIPLSATFSNLLVGNGAFSAAVPSASQKQDLSQGTIRFSGNPLDVAIENSGYFEVQREGQIYYTRQGNFALDTNGMLTTQSGDAVRGLSGELMLSTAQPTISRLGEIMDNGRAVGQLKLVQFDDASQLQYVGEGKFIQADATIKLDGKTSVRQAYLEASNVNTATEMVKMIETMRHFETGQKIIQMYDAMNERAISKLGEF